MSLWQRLIGDHEDEIEEQVRVWLKAEAENGNEEYLSHKNSQRVAPIAAPGARQQLHAFMYEMRQNSRTDSSEIMNVSRSAPTSTMQSPFANAVDQDRTTTPIQPPMQEDLRVPVSFGDSRMVHLAQ